MQDRALRGHPREIYLWLSERLDLVDFRPVKHAAIAYELKVSAMTVTTAMRLLITRGYIRSGERHGPRGERSYRLLYSVARPPGPRVVEYNQTG